MNSSESWDLRVDKTVHRQTARFPLEDKRRIFAAIESLKENPYSGDLEKLKGESNVWRRRVGSYRIFFEVYQMNHLIDVFKVEGRGSHTY